MSKTGDDRQVLNEALVRLGATEEELAAASDASLNALITDLALWSDRRRLTVAEVAEEAGVEERVVRAIRLRLGLPDAGDEARCRPAEIAAIRAFAAGSELFGEAPTLHFTRSLGTAAAAVAEAAIFLFASEVARPLREAGGTEASHSVGYHRAVLQAMSAFSAVPTTFDAALRMHFEAALNRFNLPTWTEPQVAIGFADLVGSTARADQLGPVAAAEELEEFDALCTEAAGQHQVRLVKLLGDGAMFAAPNARAVAEVLEVVQGKVAESEGLGQARAAMAFGAVAARDGDYFGPVVNLAWRLTERAEPGELLCDGEVAAQMAGPTTEVGQWQLKGFSEAVVVHRIEVPGRGRNERSR